jgi:hypothetical protein
LGRFITPDWSRHPEPIPYADFADPQTLNQYSYVRNIATSKTDEDGHVALVDDAAIGILIVGTIAVVALDIYVSQPNNARNLSNALSGAVSTVGSWFHKSPPSTSTTTQTGAPGTTTTTVQTAAKDAARQEGETTPVEHGGDGHFHPTDQDGNKIPNSTHHEYPH